MNEKFTVCLHCKAPLEGKYCQNCGLKKVQDEDKTFLHFFQELFSSLFFADGKLLKTFRVMLSKPGELSRVYISGDRKRYIAPLQLFFFANLIYFIFPLFSTFNTNLSTQIKHLPYSEFVKPFVFEEIQEQGISYEEYREEYEAKSSNNGKLLLVVLVLAQAFIFKLLFFNSKALFFTDFIGASAYFNATYIIVILVCFPAILIGLDRFFQMDFSMLNENAISIAFMLVLILYLVFFIKRAFSQSFGASIWRSILLGICIIPSFLFYRFVLFWVTYWMV